MTMTSAAPFVNDAPSGLSFDFHNWQGFFGGMGKFFVLVFEYQINYECAIRSDNNKNVW